MEVGLARLELSGFLHVLRDVLDEDLTATRSEQVLHVRVELDRRNLRLMDLGRRNTSFSHLLLRVTLRPQVSDLLRIPERDSTVLHTSGNDSVLVDPFDPVHGCEQSGGGRSAKKV